MKKSFMTRALATGLSLAMACSLSVADVSTAAAASLTKVTTKTITEGKSTKVALTTAAAKKYKIKSYKLTATAKQFLKAEIGTAKKAVTITAKKNAVTNAGATQKNLKITLNLVGKKDASVKKTAKVNVVVKAKPEVKLTMEAKATKVKEITVTFNKAVDTTATKLVVKKGAATPTVVSTTFATDAKSAVITMGTKLTAGTYTVEATVGEEVLSAEISVEDEKLTKYELVGTNLVASATVTTIASISYKALNQYDEMMVADAPTVTCTFGSTAGPDGGVTPPSADKSGTITVAGINPALAIPDTTGTIVLVDSKSGTNLQTTVTYKSKAFASSATVYGVYNTKTGKLVEGNLTTGAKISEYAILMSVKDQYEGNMTPKAIKDSGVKVNFTAAPILTDLTLVEDDMDDDSKFTEVSYEGNAAFLVPLKSKDGSATIKSAGTLSVTVVSAGKGVIATPSITIDEAKIIKTLSVTPESTLYAGKANKLVVEAYDAAGNAITKYDDLNAAGFVAKSESNTSDGTTKQEQLELKKNADGTGTLYFNPKNLTTWIGNDNKKESTIATIVFTANSATSTDYLVKTINVTYYEKPVAVAVSGKGDKTITACAVSSSLKLDLTSLVYEDQYGNAVKVGDQPANPVTGAVSIFISKNNVFNDASERLVTDEIVGNNLVLDANQKGDATLYFNYGEEATADKYDIKLPISATLVNDMVASDLKVVVNNGNAINASSTVSIVKYDKTETTGDAQNHKVDEPNAYVYVTGVVNGKTVVLPSSQYTVITDKIWALGKFNAKDNNKTETRTITVVVDSASGAQTVTTDVTVSNVDPTITTLKESAGGTVTVKTSATANETEITAADLIKAVKVMDQYGNTMEGKEADFTYNISQTGIVTEGNKLKVTYPSTQAIKIVLPAAGDYTADLTITTKDGKITFTKAIKMTTNAS